MTHANVGEAKNILDFGVVDPARQSRGWGGGNHEDAIIGEFASSRSYMTGPIVPGQWAVVVGLAQIAGPDCSFNVTVTLSPSASLPPQVGKSKGLKKNTKKTNKKKQKQKHTHTQPTNQTNKTHASSQLCGRNNALRMWHRRHFHWSLAGLGLGLGLV